MAPDSKSLAIFLANSDKDRQVGVKFDGDISHQRRQGANPAQCLTF